MKLILKMLILSLSALLFFPIYASSATLDYDAFGYLIGAKAIDVGGSQYDVSFVYGSCVELFSGCDQQGDIFWQNIDSAAVAGDALVAQVLVETTIDSFNWEAGISPELIGALVTVYDFDPFGWDTISLNCPVKTLCQCPLGQYDLGAGCEPITTCPPGQIFVDYSCKIEYVYVTTVAKYVNWTLASNSMPIPEPTTILLLGSGLAGLLYTRRKGRG